MVEKLAEYFWYNDYGVQKTNFANVRILYKADGTSVNIVVLFDFDMPPAITEEQYLHIQNQIENGYHRKGYLVVRVLCLICTKDVAAAKPYCQSTSYTNWVIDIEAQRLMIFENQTDQFGDVAKQIDDLLHRQPQRKVPEPETTNPTTNTHTTSTSSSQQMPDFDEPVYTTNIPSKKEMKQQTSRGSSIQEPNRSFLSGKAMVTILLILINTIVFLAMEFTGGETISTYMSWGATSYYEIVQDHEIYRLFTAVFLHANVSHIVSNMVVLAVVGYYLEPAFGSVRFLITYLAAGVIANIGSVYFFQDPGSLIVGLGASGAISGVMGALLFLMVRYRNNLMSMRSVQFFVILAGTAYKSFKPQTGVDNVCHIIGFISGIIVFVILDLFRRRQRTG